MRSWRNGIGCTRDWIARLGPWLVLGSLPALAGCVPSPNASPSAAPTYQTVSVKRGPLSAVVTASGAIALSQMANISPEAGSTSSSAKLKSVDVKVGQEVTAGQQLAQLQTDGLSSALQEAKINLTIAQSRLDALQHPDTTSLHNQVQQAKTNLASAQTKLEATRHPYADADIANAENAVRNDQLTLRSAQQSLDATNVSPAATSDISAQEDRSIYWTNNYITTKQAFDKGNATQDKLNSDYRAMLDAQAALEAAKLKAAAGLSSAQQAVAVAQAGLQKDQAALAQMQAGPKASDLQLAEQQLQLAQQSYDAAQRALAGAVNDNDVKQAQANVELAQANVNQAQHALDAATLRAPFAGTVIAVGASPGDSVTPATNVVTVADLTKAEVDINVNQLDIGKLAVGLPAAINVPAFPGRRFGGKVAKVASTATNSQGVITYAVAVDLDSTGSILKAGMSATAGIVVESVKDALKVPAAAVQSAGGRSFVLVPPDMHREPVKVGISDGVETAITSGLNDGESVAVLTQAPGIRRANAGSRNGPAGAGAVSAVKFVGVGPPPGR
ncbi:MAG: efflux RND transporter periplasmic adaptor subunit [Chloroflexota bacterium]|nr:efflux RND transporter periplasmic adaptor subunit [Chloroflexota bacterium]